MEREYETYKSSTKMNNLPNNKAYNKDLLQNDILHYLDRDL